MIGVLVMAGASLLADAIVSDLAKDPALHVRRVTQKDVDQVSQALHEGDSIVIIVEDGRSSDSSMTAVHLLRDDRCLRIITVSPQNHNLHIYDGYEMPASGLEQVIHLAKGFKQVNMNEVTK